MVKQTYGLTATRDPLEAPKRCGKCQCVTTHFLHKQTDKRWFWVCYECGTKAPVEE